MAHSVGPVVVVWSNG